MEIKLFSLSVNFLWYFDIIGFSNKSTNWFHEYQWFSWNRLKKTMHWVKKNAGIYIAQFSCMFTRKIELEMSKTWRIPSTYSCVQYKQFLYKLSGNFLMYLSFLNIILLKTRLLNRNNSIDQSYESIVEKIDVYFSLAHGSKSKQIPVKEIKSKTF